MAQVEISEGSVSIGTFTVAVYIDENGASCSKYAVDEGLSDNEVLAAIERIKFDLLWYPYTKEDDE